MSQYLIALDTCVLLDLADHSTPAWHTIRQLRLKHQNCQFSIVPTVIVELTGHLEAIVPERVRLSQIALENLRAWHIMPINFVGCGHGIIEQIANKMFQKRILPATERNDAFFLAESALLGCSLVVSNDSHITEIDEKKLSKLLESLDVTPVKIQWYLK